MLENFLKAHDFAEIEGNRFIIDMMYAKDENITMRPVYKEIGFGTKAIAHVDVVDRLYKLSRELEKLNLKMRIFDAYRPPYAHTVMMNMVPVEGLFASSAERSMHCYGTAVDCCLTDEKGRDFKYPTKVDAYDLKYARQLSRGETEAYYEHLKKGRQDFFDNKFIEEINNREFLKKLMTGVGFEIIGSEWWHYQLPNGRTAYPLVNWNEQDWL